MYDVWVRVDRETRMMLGCTMHVGIVQAHEFAEAWWGGRAYEIDYNGETVFVSCKAAAILNGGQYSLF